MSEAEEEDSVQRWTAKRRAALVVSILKGQTSIAEAARTHGLTVASRGLAAALLGRGRECLAESA
jgi:transposase-like protein